MGNVLVVEKLKYKSKLAEAQYICNWKTRFLVFSTPENQTKLKFSLQFLEQTMISIIRILSFIMVQDASAFTMSHSGLSDGDKAENRDQLVKISLEEFVNVSRQEAKIFYVRYIEDVHHFHLF